MFRKALKRYAAVRVRQREGDATRHDLFVSRHKFATLYLAPSGGADDGRLATYRTATKEYALVPRNGTVYVMFDGHRVLKVVPPDGEARGACQLAEAAYDFGVEETPDGPRFVVRRDGKAYALGFKPEADGEREITVGNSLIESADLHPLLAALVHRAIVDESSSEGDA